MTNGKWRRRVQGAIAKCLAEHNPQTAAEFRKVVFDYYPFGMRKYTPYKVWLEEVKAEAERIEHQPTPPNIRDYWLNPPLRKG